MSNLSTALGELRTVLRDEATTPATYQEGNTAAVNINIILPREELKNIDEKGTERPSYERQILIPADEINATVYLVPHAGARIAYTDKSGAAVVAEVSNDMNGQPYRLTKSNGFWFRVFTKQLI